MQKIKISKEEGRKYLTTCGCGVSLIYAKVSLSARKFQSLVATIATKGIIQNQTIPPWVCNFNWFDQK